MNVPVIYVNEKEYLYGLPSVKIFSDMNWIKHVYCAWSRFHVFSYLWSQDGTLTIKCNEPNCIVNAPDKIKSKANSIERWRKNKETPEEKDSEFEKFLEKERKEIDELLQSLSE